MIGGHGHVTPRPDGHRARCGGPRICADCARELAAKNATDPRKAANLEEASANGDGTYNGARAMAWLSEALCPGKGLSEAEVTKIWEEAKAKAKKEAGQ